MTAPTPVLAIQGLSKTFGGARVLQSVDLTINPGEILGLLGRNGSGKSTLVKILAGVLAPDPGAVITFDGRATSLPFAPGVWRALGLRFVHQNLGLTPTLTVLENLYMSELAQEGGSYIDWRRLRTRASQLLEAYGLHFSPATQVERLSPVERAQLALVRAFANLDETAPPPRLILLDEPTPFLPQSDVERLFALMRRGVERGASIMFITHDVDEVMTITDRVAVLRDGALVGTGRTADVGRAAIVKMIVGETVAQGRLDSHQRKGQPGAAITVQAACARRLAPTDLDLRAGEIVGLTGLVGSGYEMLPQVLFGARAAASGTLTFAGEAPLLLRGLTSSMAIDRGVAFVPGDRLGAGCIGALSIADNLFFPSLCEFTGRGRLDRGRMMREAQGACDEFGIRPATPGAPVNTLSGGNAQKVLMARWLRRTTRLLLVVEPTQGVDVGARRQIMQTLREAADKGTCVVCATSDAEQLADLCDRVAIFAQGRLRLWLSREQLSKTAVVAACYAASDSSQITEEQSA